MSVGVRKKHRQIYLGQTTSTCPACLHLVTAKIHQQDGRVYLDKWCPEHGASKALIDEDAEYYLQCVRYSQPGSIPHSFAMPAKRGCPHDCGLCTRHEQHCCHPIVEITNHCNLNCPICMADHRGTFHMSLPDFKACVDHLVEAEGVLENLTLSGGEPTLHPELSGFLDAGRRSEIMRLSLVTNGIRIAGDPGFCDELKQRGVYVILQYDGSDAEAGRRLRGADLAEVKAKALDQLEQRGIPCQLLFVAARHVNEDRLGHVLDLLLRKTFVLSLAIQPLVFARSGKDQDPLDRLTISGIINRLATQSKGLLKTEDFFPLPCPNPQCVSLTYLLATGEGEWTPLPRFVDVRRHLGLLAESATLSPSLEMEESLRDILSDLWSTSGECPQNERVVSALRTLLQQISAPGLTRRARQEATEASAKSIFIHHYMDRYNFDLDRLPKCCHHYPQADGRSMPICSHNLFYRGDVVHDAVG